MLASVRVKDEHVLQQQHTFSNEQPNQQLVQAAALCVNSK